MKIRVLVIEDEEEVRETICDNLRAFNFEVAEARDGAQGIQLIDTGNPPHIVITDIIMPHKEGLETILEIRKKFPGVRLVAISGGGRTKTMDFLTLAEKLGADAIIPKPLDMGELARTVRMLSI